MLVQQRKRPWDAVPHRVSDLVVSIHIPSAEVDVTVL